MKWLLILCIPILGMAGIDWLKVIGTSTAPVPPEVRVVESEEAYVRIMSDLYGLTTEEIEADGKTFQRIKIPDEAWSQETADVGKPQIPYIRLLIAVPNTCDFDITVNPSDYYIYDDCSASGGQSFCLFIVPRRLGLRTHRNLLR